MICLCEFRSLGRACQRQKHSRAKLHYSVVSQQNSSCSKSKRVKICLKQTGMGQPLSFWPIYCSGKLLSFGFEQTYFSYRVFQMPLHSDSLAFLLILIFVLLLTQIPTQYFFLSLISYYFAITCLVQCLERIQLDHSQFSAH